MGIRITAFAVDCGGFRDWLNRSVGDAVFYIAEHGVIEPPIFSVFDPPSARVVIVPGRQVLHIDKGRKVPLTRADTGEVPVLQRRLGEHLRQTDCYGMMFLFYSMSTCPGVTWVRELTSGYRPGWVFSLLLGAQAAAIPQAELAELERLCAKILRGFQYRSPAYPLEPHRSPPTEGSLPVLPLEDSDNRMAVFSGGEIKRWFELTDAVLARNARFPVPPIWKEIDGEYIDETVRELLQSLGTMRRLSFADPRLVTFIS